MKEYDDATLHKVQQLELMILRDVLSICKKYNLKLFVVAGSALGAVRHQGFIPWDDDIDVSIMRDDYDVLVKHLKDDMSDKYIVMNAGTDPNYSLMTTRIMLKDTVFREEALKSIHCFFGIFLDVYVLDNLPDNEKQFKKLCRQAFIISKLQILRSIAFPVLPYKGMKAKLTYVITGFAHVILVIFCVSKKKLYCKGLNIVSQYQNQVKSKRIGFLFDTFPKHNIYEREDVFPLRTVKFNGIDIFMPRNEEKSLQTVYGDFMQLPPVEKRKNHYPYELDFGKYRDIPVEDIEAGKYDKKI